MQQPANAHGQPPRAFVPTWLLAAAALLLALALRWPYLYKPLWLDETATLWVLRSPLGIFFERLREDTHHPAYFMLLRLVAHGANSIADLRSLSLLADCLILLGFWQLGRRGGRSGAALALAGWGALPLAVRFATEMRPYSALAAAVLWSALLALAPARPLGWRYGAVLCALVSLHPVGILVALALLGARFHWRTALLTLPAAALFALLHWGFAYSPQPTAIGWMPPLSLRVVTAVFDKSLGLPTALDTSGQMGGSPLGLLVFMALWALSSLTAASRRWLLCCVLYLAMLVGYSILVQPIFWLQSFYPAFVLTCAGATSALAALAVGEGRRRALALGGVGVMALSAAATFAQRQRATDPSSVAAAQALAMRYGEEYVGVYPPYLELAFLPLLQPQSHLPWALQTSDFVQPFGAGERSDWCGRSKPYHRLGPVLLRLADNWSANQALRADVQALAACTRHAQRFFIWLGDDNDWQPQAWPQRAAFVALLEENFSACAQADPKARVLEVICTPRR